MSKNPNPQGKGGSPVLATLDEGRRQALTAAPKQIDQVTTELFTSLFVLESDFRFKPVPGKAYFLYRQADRDWLGLTPPSMMSESVGGRFIGTCMLQADRTWTLELAPEVADDADFMADLAARREAFEQRLEAADSVDAVLPVYERRMAFHRRASAFAVAHSLGRSMQGAGIAGLSYTEAKGLIGHASKTQESD